MLNNTEFIGAVVAGAATGGIIGSILLMENRTKRFRAIFGTGCFVVFIAGIFLSIVGGLSW